MEFDEILEPFLHIAERVFAELRVMSIGVQVSFLIVFSCAALSFFERARRFAASSLKQTFKSAEYARSREASAMPFWQMLQRAVFSHFVLETLYSADGLEEDLATS